MHPANRINFNQHTQTHAYTLHTHKKVNDNFRVFKLETNEKCNEKRNDHENGNNRGLRIISSHFIVFQILDILVFNTHSLIANLIALMHQPNLCVKSVQHIHMQQ